MSHEPIVRVNLSVEHMRHEIAMALTKHELELTKMIKEAVDAEFTAEKIQEELAKQIKRQVGETIKASIEGAIRDTFYDKEVFGTIRQAVITQVVENGKSIVERSK